VESSANVGCTQLIETINVEVALDHPDVGELVEKYGYTAHIHNRGEENKENSGLSSKKMGSRENSFVGEPIPKTAHRMGKEKNAMLHFASSWVTFRAAGLFG